MFLINAAKAKSGSSHFDGLGSVLLALQWLLLLCLLPASAQAADAPIYRQVIKTFHNDSYYTKGLPATETVADGAGRVFAETTNTYALKDVGTGNVLTGAAQQSVTATAFPQLTETVKTFFEGGSTSAAQGCASAAGAGCAGAAKSTKTTFAYDDLGNVTTFTDFGDVGTDDDLIATISYHSLPAVYVMSEPSSIVVKNSAGEIVRRRESTLNAAGDLTELRRYLGNGQAVTHNFTYYPNGNVQTVQRPANAAGQRYLLSYSYDADVATHVTAVTDSFGYTSRASHDLRWGAVSESRDINGQPITSSFDTFGRLSSITGPYEQQGSGSQGQATLRFAYHPDATIPWALTRHYDEGRADPLETVLFTDGLKRVLQTKKDGAVDASGSGTASDVMIVSGRVLFDAFGRTTAQYHPSTEGLGQPGVFNASFNAIAPTRTTFDVLDRELQTTLPDNNVFRTTYDFGTDRDGKLQFRTTATDANNVKKERFTDVRGRQTALKEANLKGNQPTLWTSYRYNALNELVQVKDDKNNLTTAEYDTIGRRTALQNPDAGREERVYDAASNLVQRITSNLREKGVAIQYDYDFERLSQTRYPLYPDNNVTYLYGSAQEAGDAQHNRAGRLKQVTDASGREVFYYGALGETTRTDRTLISLTGKGARTYTTRYRYDSWNRLRDLTYPDGEQLTYGYNSGGLLQSIQGQKGNDSYAYLNTLTYDAFEQRVYQAFGNGTTMRYAYEPARRRLATLKSANATRTFMDVAYGYDAMTNILSLQNQAPAGTQPDAMGGPTEQTFGYDDLYRLTKANGHWTNVQGHQEKYDLTLTYDSIHNITSKKQHHVRTPHDCVTDTECASLNWLPEKKTSYDWTYTYGSPKPHAATQIGDRAFGYDSNGNQLGWTHDKNGQRRGMVWDEENRIRALSDNGRTQTYVYDANGDRVIKRGRQGETTYVNGYFVIRNGAVASKHVFNGSQRIATKLVMQESTTITDPNGNGSGNNNGVGNGNTPPGWIMHGKTSNPGANFPSTLDLQQQVQAATAYDGNVTGGTVYEHQQYFYHPDHVGSTGYVTDANGAVYEHLEYFPFGETWVQERSNAERTPYLFTGKELDEETGLYYFGARYYDPRTSQWQSADPILSDYFNGRVGGVYEPTNLAMYSYGRNNPVTLWDADGNIVPIIIGAVVLIDKGIAGYDTYQTAKSVASGETSLSDLAKGKAVDMVARKAMPGGSIVGKVIDRFKKTPVAAGVEQANKEIAQQTIKKAKSEISDGGDLVGKAEKIRKAGNHPASRNQRTIAVGEDSDGDLFAGSSNGFDRGQRAAAEELGIKCVSCKKGQHAEENLLREVPGLKRVGTSSRAPCGAGEHNCRAQLKDQGVEIDNDNL